MVLNATSDLDEDTKEALMGHSLPGSRGNYFDLHDIDEIAGKYNEGELRPGNRQWKTASSRRRNASDERTPGQTRSSLLRETQNQRNIRR